MPKALKTGSVSSLPSAVVYCEGNFSAIDGKTANGLVRHSDAYNIVGVIDSQLAGRDAGRVLDDSANGIPIYKNLDESVADTKSRPKYLIFGLAPATGVLSPADRTVIMEAISQGMSIVSGLHEFLNDDPELKAASLHYKVQLIDVRRPKNSADLRVFSGQIHQVKSVRIAILGTDCAIGKRTTATILVRELRERGLGAVLISTGQTGMIQGARYGVALDAVPSQFCAGELEATILEAYEKEAPDVMVIEGQGALSHPAFSTSSFILRGSCPHAVILQHAPGRKFRCDFEGMKMPSPESEINLIQTFTDTKVIGLTINHENMSISEVDDVVTMYESEMGIPAMDPLRHSGERLCEFVLQAFPPLAERMAGKPS